jgi:hypothetical protein
MIRVLRNNFKILTGIAVFGGLFIALAGPSRAAIETDPAQLYQTMRKAYDEGSARNWPFEAELYYQSTVFDAGRAYSLFRPEDPQYGGLAEVAVDVATQLNYNPLVNNDAALWYVLEVCDYVVKNGDEQHKIEARRLQQRLLSGQADPKLLAQQAEEDAELDAQLFRRDGDALVNEIVTDVRCFNLTHDFYFRSLLLEHAADPSTPLVRVPDPEYLEMFDIAERALREPSYTEDDRANARAIAYRREHTPELKVIARVSAIPHELRLTRTAPADEYFGDLKYSPLGVRNEVIRINKYLDKGWGYRMEPDALQVDSAMEDWQKQYPHDSTLPHNMLDAYRLLSRVDTPKTKAAAQRIKDILLIQYSTSRATAELASS